jgi:hypothetical protein
LGALPLFLRVLPPVTRAFAVESEASSLIVSALQLMVRALRG